MNAEQRQLRARVASHTSWAKTPDRSARTAAGRRAADARFELQIRAEFPDLTDAEVVKRAESLRKAFYAGLALKSAKARAAKK